VQGIRLIRPELEHPLECALGTEAIATAPGDEPDREMRLPELRLGGDDLVELIESAFVASGDALRSGDVLVVAQKVISKAEGGSELLMDVAHRTGRCGSPPS
jgi:hypothetical protein